MVFKQTNEWVICSDCIICFISSSNECLGMLWTSRSCANQEGPLSQNFEAISWSIRQPLDKISAGLDVPGQWYQEDGELKACIAETLFETNIFKLYGSDLIHCQLTSESVQ